MNKGIAQIHLRPATAEDSQNLFEWRNDPQMREAARTTHEVPWEEHTQWYQASLQNPDRHIYIAMDHDIPVGMIRTDKEPQGLELSWNVAPQQRGRGVGTAMLKTLLQQLEPQTQVFAEIKPWNEASIKMAQAAGLTFDHTSDEGLSVYLNHPSSS